MTEKFIATLRSSRHSLTPLRLGLFAYLDKRGPVTTTQLVADNTQLGDRASLYRALSLFRQLKVIEDVVIASQRLIELTDSFERHHHHLTCERCGRSITITDPRLEQLVVGVAASHGFKAHHHSLEIAGLCNRCQTAKSRRR